MKHKKITLRDPDGKTGRLQFVELFTQGEWQDMRAIVQAGMGEPTTGLIDRLPRMTDDQGGVHIGWWLPYNFQAKTVVCEVPSGTQPSPEGLGWVGAVALAKHKKDLLALCEAHADLNRMGEWRLYTRESNTQYQLEHALHDPFANMAGAKRMLMEGSIIETEDVDALLAMQGTVIYHPEMDAYMDPQHGWRPLNHAKVFSSLQEAEDVIKKGRILAGAMTASLGLRIEGFAKPHLVGSKVRAALSQREADAISQATAEAAGDPISNRLRRRI